MYTGSHRSCSLSVATIWNQVGIMPLCRLCFFFNSGAFLFFCFPPTTPPFFLSFHCYHSVTIAWMSLCGGSWLGCGDCYAWEGELQSVLKFSKVIMKIINKEKLIINKPFFSTTPASSSSSSLSSSSSFTSTPGSSFSKV